MGVLPEASPLPSDFPSTLLLEEGYLYLSKFRSGNRCAFGLRVRWCYEEGVTFVALVKRPVWIFFPRRGWAWLRVAASSSEKV